MPLTEAQDDVKNVLIAEDDNDDYLIFSIAIEELSYTVLLSRATDGRVLLKLLEEKLPDILFLDILMPAIEGRECLREIRANKKYDTLPIIMYTSLDDLKNIEFCYREGSNLYTIKPNTIGELKHVLERILSIDWKKTLYFPTRSEFVLQ
jgi:DNA-binding response OmpR family regulator